MHAKHDDLAAAGAVLPRRDMRHRRDTRRRQGGHACEDVDQLIRTRFDIAGPRKNLRMRARARREFGTPLENFAQLRAQCVFIGICPTQSRLRGIIDEPFDCDRKSMRADQLGLAAEVGCDKDFSACDRLGRHRVPAAAAARRDVGIDCCQQLRALMPRESPAIEHANARIVGAQRCEYFRDRGRIAAGLDMDQQPYRRIGNKRTAERGDEPLRRIARQLRGDRKEHKVAMWIAWCRNLGMTIVAIDTNRHELDRNTHAGGAKRVALERIRHQ